LKGRGVNFGNAPGPELTSATILDAISSPYPATRYTAGGGKGFPGWLVVILAGVLPDRMLDLFV